MKPPYRVPTMKEIEALPWNGYNVVSTFSGGGGSCLGYRMAGFRVLYASEFVEEAQRTYKQNHPDSFLDTRDIRQVQPEEILSITGLKRGELDIFDGSPPCCAFSTSGSREASWNKTRLYSDGKHQRVDDLFFEYTRILKGLQPKVFIAENVSGLVKGKALGYFKLILTALKDCGYTVQAQLINAKWLGVPQARERLIFMGMRTDLNLAPVYPQPLPYFYTLGEALNDLPPENEKQARELCEALKPYKIYDVLRKIPRNPLRIMRGRDVLPSDSYFNLTRESMFKPCSTILQTSGKICAAGTCHPLEDRKFTIPELKRIMSVPDDFRLTGTYTQQWERLGRMVPPVMMASIAETVRDSILPKT